ncbi:MAG: YARHG domain-containing protein [Candidatus Weimeria sp.]
MSDQTSGKQDRPKTGLIIAVAVITVAVVLCVLLFFAARYGIIDIPFIGQQSSVAEDSGKSDSDGTETEEPAEVIDQPVDQLTDYSSLAGDISVSAGKADTSGSDSSSDTTDGTTESDEDYIFPESSEKSISKSDIEALSDEDLRIAINEIYARHGYIFGSSEEMRDYFDTKDWYEPDENMSDMTKVKLSKIEKKNIDKMSAERNKRKKDGTWPY